MTKQDDAKRWTRDILGGAHERQTELPVQHGHEEDGIRLQSAKEHHEMHDAYMGEYVSGMRARIAWHIFSLILIWLLAMLFFVGTSAAGCINIRFFSAILGSVAGGVAGALLGRAFRNKRNIKDLKQVYKYPRAERQEIVDRNIQLRVMRGEGCIPCAIAFTVFGGIAGYLLSPLFMDGILAPPFKLSDSVILMLIGTTTGTVIGLFVIVLHWLFPRTERGGRKRRANKGQGRNRGEGEQP